MNLISKCTKFNKTFCYVDKLNGARKSRSIKLVIYIFFLIAVSHFFSSYLSGLRRVIGNYQGVKVLNFLHNIWLTEAYWKPSQTSKMELFVKIISSWNLLTILVQWSTYTSDRALNFPSVNYLSSLTLEFRSIQQLLIIENLCLHQLSFSIFFCGNTSSLLFASLWKGDFILVKLIAFLCDSSFEKKRSLFTQECWFVVRICLIWKSEEYTSDYKPNAPAIFTILVMLLLFNIFFTVN